MNERQTRFVAAYLVDPNGTRAAIAAGYAMRGAHVHASRMLRMPKVRAAILAQQQKVAEASGIDAAWVLRELAALWKIDVRALYNEKGKLRPIHELPDAAAKLVQSFEVLGTGATKVRTIDRMRVLELIGKHIDVGAFREQLQLAGHLTHEQALDELARTED